MVSGDSERVEAERGGEEEGRGDWGGRGRWEE